MSNDFLLNALSLFTLAELDIFKDKSMPIWMKEHRVFKDKKDIKKVFKGIGLPNFREPMSIDLSGKTSDALANKVIEDVLNITRHIPAKMHKDAVNKANTLKGEELNTFTDGPEWKKYISIKQGIASFNEILNSDNLVISEPDGKLKIILPENAIDSSGKIILMKGQSIFKAYNNIKLLLKKLSNIMNSGNAEDAMPDIEMLGSVKTFHKNNVPEANLEIVFTSEGQGAWDLATMSERGIESCQSWGSSLGLNKCLIGSIISKYVGIIYLTSGKDFESKGEKMIKRCIVRFGVDTKTKEPVIILDKMWSNYSEKVAQAFINALQKRTKYKVLNYAARSADKYEEGSKVEENVSELPDPKDITIPTENLNLEEREFSYMDTPFNITKNIKEPEDTPYAELASIIDDLHSELITQKDNELDGDQIDARSAALTNISERMNDLYYKLDKKTKLYLMNKALVIKYILDKIIKSRKSITNDTRDIFERYDTSLKRDFLDRVFNRLEYLKNEKTLQR